MGYYTREDLKLKTYDKLYKIAINEKLINIFASDKTKSELIDLILLYRQDNTEKKILTLDYEGFFRLQELFDKKLRELPIEATDIQVPYSIKIFENADFSEADNYYVLVSKNLHISTSICMITADNGYVYCILSLVEDTKYEDKVYRKYKINSEYVERLNFDCEYYKNPKMYFFENTMGDIVRNVYFNNRIDVIPEKIPCYSIKLFELKAEKLKEVKSPFPILFIDNKVYCKYFTKDFLMYIHKIQNDNFLIDYFENAKDRVLAKELNFYASCFQDMSTFFLDINSNIEVYDDYLQSKIVSKKQLVNQFIEYLIKKICAYSKCRYTKIYSIGLNIQDDRFVYIDLPFVLSYSKIKRLNKTYKSEKFLAIVSEFDNLNISENQFNIFEKEINSHKNDSDFIDESIRNRMKGFWYVLLTKEMITKEKYNRLMRNTMFSTEELSGFVARQLVETRQSTLEIKKLFESIFPKTDIICVKAGLVSDFREQFEIIKVRELNDTHHAQDAYLNIVVGNVYNAKFTKNFWKLIQSKQRGEINKSLNLKKTFDYDVYQDSKQVWNKETDKNIVKTMCERKTVNVTKMLCEDKGQLFNLTIEKKCKKDNKYNIVPNIPKALKGMNINPSEISEKYGSYSGLNAAYFVIFKYTKIIKKKNEEILKLEPIYIYENNKKLTDSDIIKKLENLGYNNPVLITRIKKNQKILLNGYPYRINGGSIVKQEYKLELKNDFDLYVDGEYLKYAKDLSNFCKDNDKNDGKNENVRYFVRFKKKKNINEKNETYDECVFRLNDEFNKLFCHLCIEKSNFGIYENYMNIDKIKALYKLKNEFEKLSLKEKSNKIKGILQVYNRTTYGILSTRLQNRNILGEKIKNLKIINESITGLITNEMEIK